MLASEKISIYRNNIAKRLFWQDYETLTKACDEIKSSIAMYDNTASHCILGENSLKLFKLCVGDAIQCYGQRDRDEKRKKFGTFVFGLVMWWLARRKLARTNNVSEICYI